MRHPDFPSILPVGFLASTTGEPEVIDFDPVPRKRRRHDGWTEARQRVFIQSLAACGSISAAARHVGKTARSAYRLLDSEGATSFSLAWDRAIEEGIERTRSDALNRALFGALVPIYRRGKLQRVELRKSDRLALGLLGGNRQSGSQFGSLSAEDRAAQRADFRRYDAAAPGVARELVVREVVAEIGATCARRRAREELEAQAIAAYERTQWDDRTTNNG